MPANPVTGLNTVPLDSQMVPGATYTFQFKCANTFCLTDLSSAFQSEITTYGPAYAASLQVSSPASTNLYNVQFTYTADGSDVVSDVANELIVAAQQGGDAFTFVGAVEASAAEVTVGITQAATFTASTAGKTIGSILGGAASAATSSTSFMVILTVIVLAVVAYFLTVSGAGAALRSHTENA